MRISQNRFSLFWSSIGAIFLILGFKSIHDSKLEKSVPTIVTFLLKHFFVSALCFSSIYGLLMRPRWGTDLLRLPRDQFYMEIICPLIHLLYFYVFFDLNIAIVISITHACYPHWRQVRNETTYWRRIYNYMFVVTAMVYLRVFGWKRSSPFLISHLIVACIPIPFPDIFLPVREHERVRILNNSKVRELIEFVIALVCSALFQNFYRLNSFHDVLAFFYLAVAWLANIVLVSPSHDFGVLKFLLGNVIVGCMVGQFGLRSVTWIAYGASIVLYSLRVVLGTAEFMFNDGQPDGVECWKIV